ncbi:MFS transporter [Pseudomonas alabamensis]|jgi:hypothetical protein|uniref:MFS transporter n=1 Tax=Pseudomonas alabamensis TaxID=3064349 RepID=UPI0011A9626B
MSSVERSIEDASLNTLHKTLAFSTSLPIVTSLLAEFLPRTTRGPLLACRVVRWFVVGCLAATRVINVLGRRPMVVHSLLWSGVVLALLGMFPDAAPAVVLLLLIQSYSPI